MRTRWISLLFLFSLAIGSCGVSQAGSEQTPEIPPSDPQIVPSADSPENPLEFNRTPKSTEMSSNPPPAEKFISLAKKDLADRLKIEADKITLVKTAEIVWPNAALGCPRPEKVYPTGRVPGFQIWLETNGTEYVYNTDFNGQVILCPEMNPDIPNSIIGPTPDIGAPIP
jgi:hypothetical protein